MIAFIRSPCTEILFAILSGALSGAPPGTDTIQVSRNRTLEYSGEPETLGECGMDSYNLAVVIVTFNTRDLVLQCLRSVCEDADRTGRSYREIVVDNASTDGTAGAIK